MGAAGIPADLHTCQRTHQPPDRPAPHALCDHRRERAETIILRSPVILARLRNRVARPAFKLPNRLPQLRIARRDPQREHSEIGSRHNEDRAARRPGLHQRRMLPVARPDVLDAGVERGEGGPRGRVLQPDERRRHQRRSRKTRRQVVRAKAVPQHLGGPHDYVLVCHQRKSPNHATRMVGGLPALRRGSQRSARRLTAGGAVRAGRRAGASCSAPSRDARAAPRRTCATSRARHGAARASRRPRWR